MHFKNFPQILTIMNFCTKRWINFYNKKNQYVGDADPSCAVIDVTICHPGQSAYVDATGEEFREALAELVDVLDGTQDFSFLKETGYLFKELEKKSGEPILVAKVLLGMPKTNGIPSIVVFHRKGIIVVSESQNDAGIGDTLCRLVFLVDFDDWVSHHGLEVVHQVHATFDHQFLDND